MAKKNNRMALSMLKEEVKVYDETIDLTVEIEGHDDITVVIHPFFKPDKVTKMLEDMKEFMMKAEQEKLNIDESDENDLIGFFIVKHFTDIKVTRRKKAKLIFEEFKLLQNSRIYKELMQVFPEESTEYVFERLFEAYEQGAKLENKLMQIQKTIGDLPLENKDIMFEAFKSINSGVTIEDVSKELAEKMTQNEIDKKRDSMKANLDKLQDRLDKAKNDKQKETIQIAIDKQKSVLEMLEKEIKARDKVKSELG